MVKKRLIKIIEYFENTPLTFNTWVVSFIAIIAIRFFLETLFVGGWDKSPLELMVTLIHGTFLFFLMSYLILLIVLKIITKQNTKKIAALLLWGQWLVVTPPIIDKLIFGKEKFWSFYLFAGPAEILDRFFHLFGENPDFGITWGTRIEVFIASILLGIYIWIKKEKIYWLLLGPLIIYLILFILGSVPSIISYFILPTQGLSLAKIEGHHIAKIFLTPLDVFGKEQEGIKVVLHQKLALFYVPILIITAAIFQYIKNKIKLLAIIKNSRFPQIIFNCGLFLLGLFLGWHYLPQNFSLDIFSVLALLNGLIGVVFIWLFAVVINDISDLKIDKITNKNRPLVTNIISKKEYTNFAFIFLFLALIASLISDVRLFLLIVVYTLLVWVYSSQPFRLRKYLLISSVLSALSPRFYFLLLVLF